MKTAKCLILLMLLLVGVTYSNDWPQFLGADRNGVSAEKELIDSFPATGPDVIWRTLLGEGMSSVTIIYGIAYTMFQDSDHQYVVALNENTGAELWKTKVAPYYRNGMGNGPRATPTVHGKKIFVFTGEGILGALNAKVGTLLWSVNTTEELGAKPSEYGMASSPLVVGDAVIVHVGAKDGAVVAYDQNSGKRLWKAGQGAAGYSSPVAMTLAGKKQIVAFVGSAVMGIDPEDGHELWKMGFETAYDCNTACPVRLDESSILISAGENHGSARVQITTENGTDFEAKEVWSSLGENSVLRAEWQTPVLYKGHLLGLDNVGGAGPITNLVCVDPLDGKQIWKQAKFGKSNLLLADGKLFISTMRGDLVLVKASSDGFEEISRAKILERRTRQAPVIANGKLFMRDDKEVVCLKIR